MLYLNVFTSKIRRICLFGFTAVSLILTLSCAEKGPAPVSQAEQYFLRGQTYTSAGDYINANDMFKKAAELEENPDYYYNLGVSYQKLTFCEDAIDAYEQTVELDPEYSEAWYNLAICYNQVNRIDDAKISYSRYRQSLNKSIANPIKKE